jgi:hypothetical protein
LLTASIGVTPDASDKDARVAKHMYTAAVHICAAGQLPAGVQDRLSTADRRGAVETGMKRSACDYKE